MENSNKHLADSVISSLKKATTEFEELQLQFALGKAEAKDKYKEFSNNVSDIIKDVKTKFYNEKDKAERLKGKLEHLQLQFALGKAETKEAISEQKKRIIDAIHDVEKLIK
jgi:hypothetical protein